MNNRAFDNVAARLSDAIVAMKDRRLNPRFAFMFPDHHKILNELREREPIFHRREFGTSREAILQMTADDFREIGASGKVYDREFVISNLPECYKTPEADDWSCDEFSIRQLADDLYQLSYVLLQPAQSTRRTTLWRRTRDGWTIVF